MKRVIIFALVLLSANALANAAPVIDVSNMTGMQVRGAVKNMSKDEYMKLYRHYNQAVLDLWSTGNYQYGFKEPRPNSKDYYNVCNSLEKIKYGGFADKITADEVVAIDKENKASVLKICMYAPMEP